MWTDQTPENRLIFFSVLTQPDTRTCCCGQTVFLDHPPPPTTHTKKPRLTHLTFLRTLPLQFSYFPLFIITLLLSIGFRGHSVLFFFLAFIHSFLIYCIPTTASLPSIPPSPHPHLLLFSRSTLPLLFPLNIKEQGPRDIYLTRPN